MEEVDKGCPMIRMGVSGWMFLLVPAYPGSPRSKAVKWLCVCMFSSFFKFTNNDITWLLSFDFENYKMYVVAILVLKLSVSYNSVMVHFDKKNYTNKIKGLLAFKAFGYILSLYIFWIHSI